MQPLLPTVSKKNSNLFEWLNLIVMEGLPFIMVESKHLRKVSKLDFISVESLMIFLGDMTRFVIFSFESRGVAMFTY